MIKILHIVHALTRGGGLSNFIMNYYRNIDRTKIQFDFIYFRESANDFKDEITTLGGRYFSMTEPSANLAFIKEREKFFKEHKGEYTALHCHALFSAALYSKTAKKYGVKFVIAHSHSNDYSTGTLRRLRNFFLVKSGVHNATHYFACSQDAAEFMFGKKRTSRGEVLIINNAVDCKKYIYNEKTRAETRKELGLDHEFVVGHVGGFVRQKNHDFLIDVFSHIHAIKPDSILLLVGGEGIAAGSTKKAIQEKIINMDLQEHVKFLGIRRDVNRLMSAMDAFVFPSIFEGFGLVLVETQASGLPSFASTNVPVTAKCTDLITYLPLSEGAEQWAKVICNYDYNENKRLMDIDLFDQYNIEKQIHILENLYLEMDKDMDMV